MECPTLIYFNGFYYLSFSAQGRNNERVVRYRYSSNPNQGFIIPEQDYFDGWGFYAGRIERFNERLILSGWVATKTLDRDFGTYMWGGNLVNHELVQIDNGELKPRIVQEIDDALSHRVDYQVEATNAQNIAQSIKFNSSRGYNYHLYSGLLSRPTKMTLTVNIQDSDNFGLTYNAYDHIFGNLNVFFDIKNNRIEFYTVEANKIQLSNPEITIPFQFNGLNKLDIIVVTEGSVIVVYINQSIAITSRAYDMAGSAFGLFSLGSDVMIDNVRFYE
jgi:beta-fructofuranosidase